MFKILKTVVWNFKVRIYPIQKAIVNFRDPKLDYKSGRPVVGVSRGWWFNFVNQIFGIRWCREFRGLDLKLNQINFLKY